MYNVKTLYFSRSTNYKTALQQFGDLIVPSFVPSTVPDVIEAKSAVNARCPICMHIGALTPVLQHDVRWHEDEEKGRYRWTGGVRRCRNEQCGAVLLFVSGGPKAETRLFPPEVIDFDATNLPPNVLSSLEEAIKTHSAGCYRASALMVRRLLEELCEDRKAGGKTLKDRLGNLGKTVVVPAELLNAADELRLMGNDAAHINAREYDQIGKEEAMLAIELAKELLKAVYQYTSLLERLAALKK